MVIPDDAGPRRHHPRRHHANKTDRREMVSIETREVAWDQLYDAMLLARYYTDMSNFRNFRLPLTRGP